MAAQGRWGPAQLLVTIDLASLLGHPHGVGGDTGWAGPLDAEACRRLACDGTVTRALVNRHPAGDQPLASGSLIPATKLSPTTTRPPTTGAAATPGPPTTTTTVAGTLIPTSRRGSKVGCGRP